MSTASRLMRRARALPIGYLYVLFAIIGGSIASPVTKAALDGSIAPIPLLATRLAVAAIVLWVVMIVVFRQRPLLERRLLIGGAIAGGLNAISLSAFYIGLVQIDASVAMVLFSTYPLVVLGLLALLGTRPTALDGVRAVLALLGVFLLVGVGGVVVVGGAAWIMVTVVFYSIHLVVVQRLLRGYSTVQITPLFVTVMALCVNVLYWLTDSGDAPLYQFDGNGWLVIGITAIFSTVLARLALTAGVQRIGSGQTALLTPIETMLVVIFSALFLGERLMPIQLVGGVLVIVSAALVFRRPVVRAEADAPEPGV